MKKAFTLIELLTVMAITAVLLTLIVLPIFQSFNLTRTAQAFADAQDKGRQLTDRIAREVGNAVSVRDAASTNVVVPDGKGGTGTQKVALPFTKLDLIPPAQGTPGSTPGVFVDPVTGKIDPTLTHPKGDVNLNVVPGATLVRWFVGLRNPGTPYNEPYTGLIMARGGDRDNLYVLRRAEVQPYVYRNNKATPTDNTTRAWRPNLAFFQSDANDIRIIDLDDPDFFLRDGADTGMYNGIDVGKNARVDRWSGIKPEVDANGPATDDNSQNDPIGIRTGQTVIQTELSRYDMIRPVVQGSPPKVVRDANGFVSVVPLVQFRPTRVANEPAAGSAAARPGEAVEGIDRIGPDTYKTSRGLWTDAIVRYYPSGYAPSTTLTDRNSSMEIASVSTSGTSIITQGTPDAGGLDTPTGNTLWDMNAYERSIATGNPYPVADALTGVSLADPNVRKFFTPFRALTNTGKIVTSFPIEQVGTGAVPGGGPNLPYVDVDVNPVANDYSATMSPTQAGLNIQTGFYGDPNLTSAPLSRYGAPGYEINRAFNRVYNQYPDLQGSLQRFLDLRFVPNADGTPSPLCPIYSGGLTGFNVQNPNTRGYVNRVRIVPGSDEVYGPDQNPGANYGFTVRYTRVTGNPGPNQYRLVYADLPEPTDPFGHVTLQAYEDLMGVTATEGGTYDPQANNYDPANILSAVIQPRFKAGYLQFDSDPNVPLPQGRITVRYRFQLNGPADTFAVDLDTREIMQILLTIKNYPQSNAPNAQTVTLKSTATLRNALR